MTLAEVAPQIAELARLCYARGWAPGTSGNFSATVSRDPLRLAITTSGVDKGTLTPDDIVEMDGLGRMVAGSGRPSAESSLHLAVVRARGAGAVLHTHSIWSTIISESGDHGVAIEGYEMLKGLDGVVTHEQRTLTDQDEVTRYLATLGIEYERWADSERVPQGAAPEEVLSAYAKEIEQLKSKGGYVTADVIDVTAQTPNLEAMLDKFRTEHWHDEDEVRFIVRGRSLFHVTPNEGAPIIAIEVEAGDLIRVPRGTWHLFDLCGDRDIRAIRLFQDKSGWTPHYTNSGADKGYQPLCMGPTYIPIRKTASH